jgi:hypothetical protein
MAQLRIPLDANRFAKGLTWKDFVAQMGDTRARTEENYAKAKLTDEDIFLNNGYQSIPVVVFFDKDWNEIGRWLERAHAATVKLTQIRATTGDNPDEYRKQLQAEYFAPGGPLWRAAANEMKLLLEGSLGLVAKK